MALALLAHRGGKREAPENSLAALVHTVASGVDGVELDVRLTADGVPVVFHDPDLRRFLGRRQRIETMTLAALSAIDLGLLRSRFAATHIPTLAEALAVAQPLAIVNLELKGAGRAELLVERTLAAVTAAGMGARVVLTSFDGELVAAARRAAPELASGWILDAEPADAAWLDCPLVSLERRLASAGTLARARARGLAVLVWTENDPATLEGWRETGAAGLITDFPRRFAAAQTSSRRRVKR